MTRTYYTFFNLIILSLTIFVGVNIFYKTARSRVGDVKSGEIPVYQSVDSAPHEKKPLSFFHVITDRNLFGSEEKTTDQMKDEEVEGLEPTSLNVVLLGTVAGDQDNARAVIEDTEKRKQGLYKVGDSIQDAVVKKILREKVILRVGDRDEILTMKEPSSAKEEKTKFRRRPDGGYHRAVSPRFSGRQSTIMVSRSDIQESMRNINELLSQARIQPHYRNGNPGGVRISRIQRGSIFSKLGLRNGDVVEEINGNPLTRAEDIFSLYERLKSGDQASLQITRRGRKKTLTYKFR
ncbi:MAG: hypothetical protein B5M55_05405 [Desulfococcus sp. 4484_242]|nr:MAG: hypothetical protein B5M55_05405 [Desulfococcus sp. 4484_242]